MKHSLMTFAIALLTDPPVAGRELVPSAPQLSRP